MLQEKYGQSAYARAYKSLPAGASALGSGTAVAEGYASSANGIEYYFQSAQNAGFDVGADNRKSRTIFAGNLDPSIVEPFLTVYFGEIGEVTKTQMIFGDYNSPYAFIEFAAPQAATDAVQSLDKAEVLDRELALKLIGKPQAQERIDTSHHFHVFVGDLTFEVDSKALRDAFSAFGNISDAKVIIDMNTQRSKGYGFVSYPTKEEAERAIEEMNGAWLGHRTIRTNWANRKLEPPEPHHRRTVEFSYSDVYGQTGPDNSSVYVGNLDPQFTDDDLHACFCKFGRINEIRILKSKGCAFVRFDNKDSACRSIVEMNNQNVKGRTIRCSWGKFSKTQGQDKSEDHGSRRGVESGYSASDFQRPPSQQQYRGSPED